MTSSDRRDEKPLVEQQKIRIRLAQIKAAISEKRVKRLQEQVEEELQPNMLEAVMLRARLANEQEPRR